MVSAKDGEKEGLGEAVVGAAEGEEICVDVGVGLHFGGGEEEVEGRGDVKG